MENETKIYGITDATIWTNLVERTPYKDLHFLPEYLSLFEDHLKSICNLFFFGNEDRYILYPFFKRNIKDINNISMDRSEEYWDIISPWYYGGPLFYGESNVDNHFIAEFLSEFNQYCLHENIISEFSREHPHFDNYKRFESLIELTDIGIVVWMDLTKDLEYLFNENFKKETRTAVRKSQKMDVEIHINNENHLDLFQNIYTKAMDAKDTRNFYYFDNRFIRGLKKNLGNNFTLISIKHDDKVIGGSIFLDKYDRMYYYLSARDPELDSVNSLHRILYEAMKFGKEKGIKHFDLGGGSEGSGLLRFKQGFSKNTIKLLGYKKVFDRTKYEEICTKAGITSSELNFENASFFPEYRIGE